MTDVPTAAWRLPVPLVIASRTSGQSRPLTTNDRLHFRVKARYVATIRDQVAWRARQAHIPPQDHVTVQLHYAPGDSRRRDAPNLVATSKPAVDALVDAGVVPDDTARWVTELMPVLHLPDAGLFTVRKLWLSVETTPGPHTADTESARPPVQQPRGATNPAPQISPDGGNAPGAIQRPIDVGPLDWRSGQ